jgi:hypothetical protein
MMTRSELVAALDELDVTQIEAAQLLSVDARTLRRWLEPPNEVPGPAEQALRAWLRLQRRGLSWRPDVQELGEHSPEEIAQQVALHRNHALELDAVLRKVESRGGPVAPWQVDLAKNRARLGPIIISFYRLKLLSNGFSPAFYRRTDGPSSMERDWPLIEDGFACIATALAEKERCKRE